MPAKISTLWFGGTLLRVASVFALGSSLLAEETSPIPTSFPPSRYEALVAKSPFAVATAAPPDPGPPAENFATNWVVTGLSKNRGQDGKSSYTVFVRSRDLATRLVLTGDKPSPDGVAIVSVDEAAIAAKSTVTLKKGEEIGKVGFDQAAISATAAPPPMAPNGASAGKAGVKPSTTAPRTPIPRPGMTAQPRATQAPPTNQVPAPRGRVRTVEEAPAPAQ